MDVDDDIVIISANIVKKPRGRPRKVRPIAEISSVAGGAAAVALTGAIHEGGPHPQAEKKPKEEPADRRPKRVCKGRERQPPKPTKPRGRYARE